MMGWDGIDRIGGGKGLAGCVGSLAAKVGFGMQ